MVPPAGGATQLAPDYCHDWRWAGVLLEELLGISWRILLTLFKNGKTEVWLQPVRSAGHGPKLPEAIARARLEMYRGGDDAQE
jgi:hypothetical protein